MEAFRCYVSAVHVAECLSHELIIIQLCYGCNGINLIQCKREASDSSDIFRQNKTRLSSFSFYSLSTRLNV